MFLTMNFHVSLESGHAVPRVLEALYCSVKDVLTCPSDFHIHRKSFQHLPAVLPPQPRQKAQDQGKLPAYDDVCRCGEASVSFFFSLEIKCDLELMIIST